MKTPRTTFAAPFVLVIGCGQPQEHASTPRHVEVMVDADLVAHEPIDAAVDAPIDAPWDGLTPAERCRLPPQISHVYCNPPPPEKPKPSPPPQTRRFLTYQIQGGDVVATVGVGSDQEIDKDWKATVVDVNDHPVPNAEAVIVRVDKRQTVVRVKKVVSDDMRDLRLRLTPP